MVRPNAISHLLLMSGFRPNLKLTCMKPNLRTVFFASAFFCIFQGLRAAEDVPPVYERSSKISGTTTAPVEIRSARITELLDRKVRNAEGGELGTIEDFVIDLENGRVVNVVLSGAAVGEDRVEVPARTFTYNKNKRLIAWPGDGTRLAKAPRFSPPGSNRPAQTVHAAEVYRYYDEEPYFLVENQVVRKVPGNVHTHGAVTTDYVKVALGRLTLASDLLGARVNNVDGKKLGTVKDLVLDLPAGRVVAVIIGGGGFLGMAEGRNALPPAVLSHASEDNQDLRLDVAPESRKQVPRYDADRFDDPTYTDSLYRAYKQEPYTTAVEADNTRINRRDRDGATLTPLDQGNSTDEVAVTARIRKAILARDGLSVNAQNVKIITRDGSITLRGPVKNSVEKAIIGEIAVREAGGSWRVDNQLEFAGE